MKKLIWPFILPCFAVVAVLIGYGLFKRGFANDETPLALFEKGKYQEANRALENRRKQLSEAEYHLYRSYITRELGDIKSSDRELKKAWESYKKRDGARTVAETYLNLLLNAYLEKEDQLLREHLSQARKVVKEHVGWLTTFSGIAAYQSGDYAAAVDLFKPSCTKTYASPWMKRAFEKTFTSSWFIKHRAYCQIELGRGERARYELAQWKDLLEHTTTSPDEGGGNEWQEVSLLMGLSYVVDAQSKSPREAIPWYARAFDYFNRGKQGEAVFKTQRIALLPLLMHHVELILKSRDFEPFSFYLSMLEGLRAEKELVAVKRRILKLLAAIPKEQAGIIAQTLQGHPWLTDFEEYFEDRVREALEQDALQQMQIYWGFLSFFAQKDHAQVQERFTKMIAKKILDETSSNRSKWKLTRFYTDFFISIAQQQERLELAHHLASLAEKKWQIADQRSEAISLMRLAKSLPVSADQLKIHYQIEESLRHFHNLALEEDDISSLFDLLGASEHLELAIIDSQDKQELLNQLDDAEYLYAQRRLEEARKKGEWVLKLDPDNERAKRLLGMIAYYQADYERASQYLEGVVPANDEMKEAQAIVEILKGNPEEGNRWLKEVEEKRSVADELYLRLVYGLLMQDLPVEALQWLEKVKGNKEESDAARLFAAYAMSSWREVLELVERLPSPYNALDGFQGITIDSLVALGDIKKAGERLAFLLRKPPQPSDSAFTPYFQAFKKSKLDPWNRNFVAALFFKDVEDDPEKALSYFDKIDSPSPLAEIEKSEVLIALGRFSEARQVLLGVLDKVPKKEEGQIKTLLYPLLGRTLSRLGFFEEALPFYRKHFASNPTDTATRAEFARVLMSLRRFDLAEEQFRAIRSERELTSKEMVDWISCLVHMEKFAEANAAANEWFLNKEPPLAEKLSLARLMIITKNSELLDYIVKNIPEPSQRSLEENQQLILFWMDLGSYNEALDLAQLLEKNLVRTAAGSMVLANLYVKLNKVEEALLFAEKALQIDPLDLKVADFIEKYERTPDVLAKSSKLLKEQLDREPENLTLQIDYANTLIELGMESYLAGSVVRIQESPDLQQALTVLEKISQQNNELPEISLLLGKVYYLLNQNNKAIEQYKKTLELDPSYTEARQHLAVAFEDEGKIKEALVEAKRAASFDPANADLWEQLADLQIEDGDLEEGVAALRNAIRFSPFDPDPYLKMARLNLEMKTPEDAVKILKALLSFAPEDIEGLKLMLKALYEPAYVKSVEDEELLQRERIDYYDRLKLVAPEEAPKALPKGVSLEPEKKR